MVPNHALQVSGLQRHFLKAEIISNISNNLYFSGFSVYNAAPLKAPLALIWESSEQPIMKTISDKKIIETINSKFNSVRDLSKKHQDKTYKDLSQIVDPDVAPIQILSLFRYELTKIEGFEYFAKDLLIRLINQYFPDGWLVGKDFSRLKMYGNWCASLPEEYEEIADEIWNRLEKIDKGWIPTGIDDKIIDHLFEGIDFGHKPS